MDVPAPAYTAIGAILAAIIAGGISFISTVLAKDQKTSEFRQAWIDGLRNDIAEEISLFVTLISSVRALVKLNKTNDEINEYLFKKEDYFCKLELVEARIKLRINPKEHSKLLDVLSNLHEYVKTTESFLDKEKGKYLVEQFIKESQFVLKTEWRRVKRGEPIFVATKWISLLVFIAAMSLGMHYVLGHLHIEFV